MSEPNVVDDSVAQWDPSGLYDQDLSDIDIPDYNPPSEASAESSEQSPPAAVEEPAKEVVEDPDAPESKVPDYDEKKAVEQAAAQIAAKAQKKVGFKSGDQSFDLTEDAVTDWKVDGKPVKVPLKDLLQNYSGKVAWETRFQEVANSRKQLAEQMMQFESNRQRHSALINDMHKAAQEGRTFDAISSMIQMTGAQVDAREYVRSLRGALIEQAKQLSQLSPEQLQLHEAKEELEYIRSQGTRLQQAREQEQAQQAFQTRVANAINGVNTTVDEYVNTRDWLQQHGPQLLGNQWDPNQVTPEFVAQQIRDVRDYRNVRDALNAVDPSLTQNQTTWKQAVDMLRANPDWTIDDLKDVYREATKQKRSQKISNKVAKSPVGTTASASTKGPKKDPRLDWSNFDDPSSDRRRW